MMRYAFAGIGTALIAMPAGAQVSNWNTGTGTWNTPANWNPMSVPNAPGESAVIGIAGTYTVTLDISPSIDTLDISNASATLAHPGGLTMVIGGGVNTNNGLYKLNSDAANASTELRFNGSATLAGTGTLRMLFPGNGAVLSTGTGATLTHSSGHTIAGTGRIAAAIVNDGTILADVSGPALVLDTNPKVNHNVIRATGGSILNISAVGVAQSSAAMIEADNAAVRFTGITAVGGGSLLNTNAGIIRNEGTLTLTGVGLDGAMDLQSGSLTVVAGPGGLTHTGTISVNSDGMSALTELRFGADSTLGGAGTVRLGFPGNGAILSTGTGATLTHGAGHTISGTGRVAGAMVNEGDVIADVSGQAIVLDTNDKSNHGLLKATGGGTLNIAAVAVNQSPSASAVADAGTVRFTGISALSAGSLKTMNGGTARNEGTLQLTNVPVDGVLDLQGASLTIVAGPAGLTHTGPVNLNSNGANALTELRFGSNSTLGGTGTLRMLMPGTSALVTTGAGATLINASGHTIRGVGKIEGSVINAGRIAPGIDQGGTGSIELAGTFSQAQSGVCEIELGGTTASDYDKLTGTADVTLGGTLEVAYVGTFTPPLNTSYTVVSAGSVSGQFASLAAPALPDAHWRWVLIYTPTSVSLRVVCAPDCNADFALDINDFICFQTKFALADPYADCDGNGVLNINDFICFQTRFALGCSR